MELNLIPLQIAHICNLRPESDLPVKTGLYAGMDNRNNIYRSMLQFDTCPMPEGAKITSAILKLYVSAMNDSENGFFAPYCILNNWNRSVTWSTQPDFDVCRAGNTLEITGSGWYFWDITAIAQCWAQNPCNNHGILLKSMECASPDIKRFELVRNSPLSYSPMLIIQYETKQMMPLCARRNLSTFECICCNAEKSYSNWQRTSIFKTYTYFVENLGQEPLNIHIQISPDQRTVIDEDAVFTLPAKGKNAFVPQKYAFFTRLSIEKADQDNENTQLKIWFQAQV